MSLYRYQKIRKNRIKQFGKTHYINVIYPDIPVSNSDQYVITTGTDRLDLLAYDVYRDESLWWIIASANSLPGDTLYPPVGMQLRIPTNIQNVITQFNSINGFR